MNSECVCPHDTIWCIFRNSQQTFKRLICLPGLIQYYVGHRTVTRKQYNYLSLHPEYTSFKHSLGVSVSCCICGHEIMCSVATGKLELITKFIYDVSIDILFVNFKQGVYMPYFFPLLA